MPNKPEAIPADAALTLDGLFRARLEQTPNALAYRQYDTETRQWQSFSWQETADEIARWQAGLNLLGLYAGDRVALSLRNSREWVIFEQAALGLGLIVIPLYTDDRPDNIAFILQDAGVKLLLVQDVARWQRLAPALNSTPTLSSILILHGECEDLQESDERLSSVSRLLPTGSCPLRGLPRDPNALATIVYTSGTTGSPKGVMLSHHNILSIAWSGLQLVELGEDCEFLSFLPLSHTLERTAGYYLPMMAGASVAFARSVNHLAEDLQTIRPAALISVPRIYEKVYARIQKQLAQGSAIKRWLFNSAVAVGWRYFEHQQGRADWHPMLLVHPLLQALVARKIQQRLGGRLRFAVSGGAPLPGEIARVFLGLGVPLLQGYGLTETSPVISVNPPWNNIPSSVGVPLPGVEVRIGHDSELQVKSPGIMLGYWNNHNATAEMIGSDGWLNTGDQACIESGHIFITGRLKDILVLSNGEKVPPGDMEMVIALNPLFEQVMVIGEGRPYLSALLILEPEQWQQLAQQHGLDPDAPQSLSDKRVHQWVIQHINRQLHHFPAYAKIRRVHLGLTPWSIDNGLMTPTMKIKRKQVLSHLVGEIEQLY